MCAFEITVGSPDFVCPESPGHILIEVSGGFVLIDHVNSRSTGFQSIYGVPKFFVSPLAPVSF